MPLLHWPCWTCSLQPIGSAWLLLAVAVGGWPLARSSTKGSAELAGCVGCGSSGLAAGSSCWRLSSNSSGSTSMGCMPASASGCLVAMLWLLLALLLLVWVALLVTNVGLVMPLLGELGTTLALLLVWSGSMLALLPVWLPDVVDMAG